MKNLTITEKIKSFEDACNALNISPDLPNLELIHSRFRKSMTASYKLLIIVEALNEQTFDELIKTCDYLYEPWFLRSGIAYGGSIAGLSDASTSRTVSDAYTSIGSRFGLKTRELARYAGNQFIDLYNDVLS